MKAQEVIQTEKGFFLTLQERKIMKLMIDEAEIRVEKWGNGDASTFNVQLKAVYQLMGTYVEAYKLGNITLRDVERCG